MGQRDDDAMGAAPGGDGRAVGGHAAAGRLPALLDSLRSFHRLTAGEAALEALAQLACQSLVDRHGCARAWAALVDPADPGTVDGVWGAGFGAGRLDALAGGIAAGDRPDCMRASLASPGRLVVQAPGESTWDDPEPGSPPRCCLARSLAAANGVRGVLAVALDEELGRDGLEQEVFGELADLLAAGLRRIDAETARAEQEGLYESLFRQNSAAMLLVDPADGAVVEANRAAERFYGWTRQELLARRVSEINTLDEAAIRAEMADAAAGRRSYFLFRHRTADGSVRDVEVHSGPVLLRGRPLLYSLVHDITEKLRWEREVAEGRELLAEGERLAGFGSWELRADGDAFEFSGGACRIMGLEPGTRVSRDALFDMMLLPEDREPLGRQFEAAMRPGAEPFEAEHRIIRQDTGEVRWVQAKAVNEHGPDGALLRSYGVFQDITDRKAAREAADRNEARLAEAQRVAHVGSWEYDHRTDSLEWSDEAYRIFGLDPGETPMDYDTFLAFVHEEDVDAVRLAYEDSLRPGGPDYEIEHRIHGARPGEVRWVRERCVHERGPDGAPVRSIGIVQDITEARAAEEARREAEVKYRLLVEQSQTLIYTLDTDGVLTFASRTWERMLGHDPREVVGKSFRELVHAEDLPVCERAFQDVLWKTAVVRAEYRVPHKDGSLRWHQSRLSTVPGADGRLVVVGNALDITDRRRAEESLARQAAHRKLAMEIANLFLDIQPGGEDAAIHAALELLGRCVEADRSYVFSYDKRRHAVSNTHEWCAEGIEPMIGMLQDCALEPLGDIHKPQLRGEALIIPCVQSLPPGRLRDLYESQDIVSVINEPLMADGRYAGFVGFDWVRQHRLLDQDESELLRLFGNTIVNFRKQRRILSSLDRSERRYRALFEGMTQGVVVNDRLGRVVDCNPAAERILGIRKDALLGLATLPEEWRVVAEDGSPLPAQDHPAAVVLRTGHPVLGMVIGLDPPDGSPRRWIRASAIPRPGPQRRPADSSGSGGTASREMVYSVFDDITEQREAEAQVRLLASQVEQSPMAVLRTDTDRRITWGNAAFTAMTGYGIEEVLGRRPGDVLQGEETCQATVEELRRKLERLETAEVELVNYSKDGRPYWIQLTVSPLRDRFGRHVGFVGFERDITDRINAGRDLAAAREELLALNKELESRVEERTRVVRRQAAALDSSLEGVAIFEEGVCIYQNAMHRHLFGPRGPEEDWRVLFDPESARAIEAAASGGDSPQWRGEALARRVDGTAFEAEVDASRLPDGELVIVTRDITARKEAERELAAREARYRAIMEGAGDAILTASVDGRILDANHTAEALLGYTKEQLAAMQFHQLHPPEELERIEFVFRSMAMGTASNAMDIPLRRQDGSVVFADVSGKLVAVGEDLAIIGVFRDITERRRTELRLNELADQLALSLDSGNIGSWSYDLATRALSWDERVYRLYGVDPQEFEVTHENWARMVRPEDIERAEALLAEAVRTGEPYECLFHVVGGDGRERTIQNKARLLFDSNGKPVRVVGINNDITALAERQEALEQANQRLAEATRQKDEFLANMSHELRTPLNAVLGLSEALQLGIYGQLDEKQAVPVQRIEESGKHLLDLINDILDLAKIEAGKVVLQPEPVAVPDLCAGAMRFMEQAAKAKGVALSVRVDPQATAVEADPRRLRQILLNLLSNAVKFTPPGGEVVLEARLGRRLRRMVFIVSDNGVGIAPEKQKLLFQPFTQLESAMTKTHGGTGLGLSIVKRLAELHGGEVWIDSEPGRGSRFTVEIPWSDSDTSGSHSAVIRRIQPGAAQGPLEPAGSILLVEDQETNIQLLTDFLGARGHRVDLARDGREGVRMATTQAYDLILMDVQLPVLDGLAATRRIRASPGRGAVPIIGVTAFAMAGDREKCLEAGMDDCITKPISLRALSVLVARCLRRKARGAGQ